MTTKTISGTYSSGYLLNGSFNAVDITASGSIGGFGLVTSGQANIQNYGHLVAQFGANGVTMGHGGGSLTNHIGGYVRGGLGITASGAGAAGNAGGAGAYLSVYGSVFSFGGDVVGGGGSAGIAGSFGGDGGFGGASVNLHSGGELYNKNYVIGGSGAAGGASSYGTTVRGGTGGLGGDGLYAAAAATVFDEAGGVIGGSGGKGGSSVSIGGYGGTGGAGVELASGGSVRVITNAFIEGGVGGAGGTGGGGGTGGAGVELRAGGSVRNFNLIIGGGGGTGVNGVNSSYHQIGSGGIGVALGGSGSSVVNYGMISGGAGGLGTGSSRGGIGGAGIAGNGSVINYGTVISGAGAGHQLSGYGIRMSIGTILNGDAVDHTATIEGRASTFGANYSGIGVVAGVGSNVTVDNYGTISGGSAVLFQSSSDVLIAEAGSVFSGAVIGGGGTIELGAGSGTVSGIDASGNVTVNGFVGSAPVFQGFGTLDIASSGHFAMASVGTIASGKILLDNGVVSDAGALTVAGSITGSGTLSVTGKLTLQNKSSLSVADLFVTAKTSKVTVGSNITYGGVWFQTNGSLSISAGRTLNLTNVADVISGKGVTVGGTLEVSGGGKLEIQGPVANNGLLLVSGGTLVLENNAIVTGTGSAEIIAAVLDASGGFNQAVSFVGGLGTLILGHSQSYTANITGFSTAGGTELDLSDVGFVSASEATFSGTTAGGVLTVSDGTHTAKLKLVGNFTGSTFTASSDGHGGVIVVDPIAGASAPPASAQAFASAMAGMGGGGAAVSSLLTHATGDMAPMLVAPHM